VDVLKVGIIGAGGMGNVHARQYRKMPDVEVAFYDHSPEKASAFCERWGYVCAESMDRLIESVDVVDVCLPTDLHAEVGLKAIASGRAVFMEKPMAGTLDEGHRLVEAADKAGVPFMPGQVVRFFPEFSKAAGLVRGGAVGTPGAARTRRGGSAPQGGTGWFMDHARSGGVIVDLAIHDFDWLRWTLGEVKEVYSRSVGSTTGTGPDYALTTLSFDSGAVAHVEATWMDPSGFRAAFEVCGSEGMIEYDSRSNAALRTHSAGRSASETPLAPHDDPYYRELKGFLEAVRSGGKPPVTGYDGLMALSIAMGAIESARTGRVVRPSRAF
jgi:predicted dehydrogenase